ncbi:LOW QUALITY PROTEIN: hypothetical protein V1477_002169, partial [Vespula maculifrons]
TQIVWNKVLVNIDINSKYVINEFLYLGKDKKKDCLIPFEDCSQVDETIYKMRKECDHRQYFYDHFTAVHKTICKKIYC